MSEEIKKTVEEPVVEVVAADSATPDAPVTEVSTTVANPVEQKLTEYGADAFTIKKIIELGVEEVGDLVELTDKDLVDAGMALVKARKLINNLKSETKTASASTATDAGIVLQSKIDSILPVVPDEGSWLSALKSGGVLKVEDSTYIAAIRAALADRAGLYKVPKALVKAMEDYADETEERVDPKYFAIRKQLTRNSYGDIFDAIPGLDGTYITDERRSKFLADFNRSFWPAVGECHRLLDGWYQNWRGSFADPGMILAVISGGRNAGLTVQAPDTQILHDAGDTLVDSINRCFKGTNIQIATAMAYRSNEICKMVTDDSLPPMIGAKNREQMLKKIGASVSSNYVRLEQNIVKFVLAFVKHDSVTSDDETTYFATLWQLGSQIDWDSLNIRSGKGSKSLTGSDIL